MINSHRFITQLSNYHHFFKTQANNYNLEIHNLTAWQDTKFFEGDS
jgi:hypothetical protein